MNEDGSELFGLSKVDRTSETDSYSGSDSDSDSNSDSNSDSDSDSKSESGSESGSGSTSDSNSDSDSDSNSSSQANSASEPNSPSNSSPPSPSSPPAPSPYLDASTSTSTNPSHFIISSKTDITSSALVDNSNNHVRLPPDTPLDELALRGLKTIELEAGQEEEQEQEDGEGEGEGDEQLKVGLWKEWEKAENREGMRTDPEQPPAIFPSLEDKPNINPHPNPNPNPNPKPINPTTITPNHPSHSTPPPPQTPITSNPTNPPAATLPQTQLGEKREGGITRLTLDDLLALQNDDPSSLPTSITG